MMAVAAVVVVVVVRVVTVTAAASSSSTTTSTLDAHTYTRNPKKEKMKKYQAHLRGESERDTQREVGKKNHIISYIVGVHRSLKVQ